MADSAGDMPTFRSLTTAFTDFLTVAIHVILYERGIYPRASFLSARKYNFAVRQSRHPKVCEWINDSVSAVETEILKGTVDKVAIVIYTEQNRPVERFVFDVSRLPVVSASELDIPLVRSTSDGSQVPVLPKVDLEEQLRATMSRLSNCSSALSDLPKGCSFTVSMELKPDGEAPLAHPQHWIPAQDQQHRSGFPEQSQPPNSNITAIRAVRAGEMVFEAYVERVNGNTTISSSTSTSL